MPAPTEGVTAYVSIGSNQGDQLATVRAAVERLNGLEGCAVTAVSPWYRSKAIGPGVQADYVNGAARLLTTLQPLGLLAALQRVENEFGRVRELKWGPRTLDLDLLLFDDLTMTSAALRIPHPRITERNFVVFPLNDIAPGLRLPDGSAIAALRNRLGNAGLRRIGRTGEKPS